MKQESRTSLSSNFCPGGPRAQHPSLSSNLDPVSRPHGPEPTVLQEHKLPSHAEKRKQSKSSLRRSEHRRSQAAWIQVPSVLHPSIPSTSCASPSCTGNLSPRTSVSEGQVCPDPVSMSQVPKTTQCPAHEDTVNASYRDCTLLCECV